MPKIKSKNSNFKLYSPRALLNWRLMAICLLIIAVLGAVSRLVDLDKGEVKVKGTASLTEKQLQSLSDSDKYTSLDLRVAKLAVYKGSPLVVTKNLGVYGSVRQYVVSFPVYSANLVEYGLMTLPMAPAPAAGYPVVVLFHGYVNPPRYSTAKAYLPQMEYYSQHGFAVIKPDFRGQGLSIKAGRPEGAFFSMAYNVDTLSLIASIKETNFLSKGTISFWGHSMGAYIALRAAVLSSDVKRVILLSGPVGSLQQMYSAYVPSSDRSNPVAQLIKSTELNNHGTPDSNPSYWYNASPTNFLNNTKATFQIHVGLKDRTVPPAFSAQLDSYLSQAKIAHQYYVYAEGDHGLGGQMPQILQLSLDFLNSKPS